MGKEAHHLITSFQKLDFSNRPNKCTIIAAVYFDFALTQCATDCCCASRGHGPPRGARRSYDEYLVYRSHFY